jgi:predicted DNA-binding protein YlxM (UPF0122 family)
MKKELSAAERHLIKTMYEYKFSVKEIAWKFGVDKKVIWDIIYDRK